MLFRSFYFLTVSNPSFNNIKSISLENLDKLEPLDIQEYIAFLSCYERDGQTYTNNEYGKSRKLSSLRSFYKYYANQKYLHSNPAALLSNPKLHEKEIIKLEKEEVTELIDGVKNATGLTQRQKKYALNTGYRDMAIVMLLLGTGIRVSELVGIDLEDISWKDNQIHILRKGGSESSVYFESEVFLALEDYLDYERNPMDEKETAFFLSGKGTRISVRSVERIVKKYATGAVGKPGITPHKLRSTYGTNLYRETGDIYLTADALGHKNIEVTARHYADIGESRRKEAAKYAKNWLQNKSDRK